MVGPGEASVTVRALEGLDAGVFPVMPRQLVRAGKLPRAAVPGAFVWLFPWGRETERRACAEGPSTSHDMEFSLAFYYLNI